MLKDLVRRMLSFIKPRKKSAVLYLSHRVDDNALQGWRALRDGCGKHQIPFYVYDNSRNDYPGHPDIPDSQVYLFSLSSLMEKWPISVWSSDRPFDQGNLIFLTLSFFNDHPKFSFYWRVEYDVFFDGSWNDFLSYYDDVLSDLVTTTIVRPEVRTDWFWWRTLKYPSGLQKPVQPLRAFMPIVRLSADACDSLARAFRYGWKGHDEVSVPTIIHHNALSILDLGAGEFFNQAAPAWYVNSPAVEGLAPGTFVCPPKRPTVDVNTRKLYHPVKDRKHFLDQLKSLKS